MTDVTRPSGAPDDEIALSYEREQWVVTCRKLEDLLAREFTGEIRLNCLHGLVMKMFVTESHDLEEERRHRERRTSPRDGDDRRHK